jgi:hypothetical protein
MTVDELLLEGRKIWGDTHLTLEEVIIRLGVVMGDINRFARDRAEGRQTSETALQKELGNVIFSMIRWCDDLGYSPQECIRLAQQAQLHYAKKQQDLLE